MAQLECSCEYCGHTFEVSAYYFTEGSKLTCTKCGDKKVRTKKKDDSKSDIFGYNRTKPFEDAWVKDDDE